MKILNRVSPLGQFSHPLCLLGGGSGVLSHVDRSAMDVGVIANLDTATPTLTLTLKDVWMPHTRGQLNLGLTLTMGVNDLQLRAAACGSRARSSIPRAKC